MRIPSEKIALLTHQLYASLSDSVVDPVCNSPLPLNTTKNISVCESQNGFVNRTALFNTIFGVISVVMLKFKVF